MIWPSNFPGFGSYSPRSAAADIRGGSARPKRTVVVVVGVAQHGEKGIHRGVVAARSSSSSAAVSRSR